MHTIVVHAHRGKRLAQPDGVGERSEGQRGHPEPTERQQHHALNPAVVLEVRQRQHERVVHRLEPGRRRSDEEHHGQCGGEIRRRGQQDEAAAEGEPRQRLDPPRLGTAGAAATNSDMHTAPTADIADSAPYPAAPLSKIESAKRGRNAMYGKPIITTTNDVTISKARSRRPERRQCRRGTPLPVTGTARSPGGREAGAP